LTSLGAKSLANSALFLVLNRLACPETIYLESNYHIEGGAKNPVEASVLGRAVEIIEQASNKFHTRAFQMEQHMYDLPLKDVSTFLSKLSLFSLDAIYISAITLHWLWLESGDESLRTKAHEIETHLERIGQRWGLAKAYSKLVRDYLSLFGPYD
jgi:hypothetical protein